MAKLPFLDRDEELARLESMVARPEGAFGVVYGRRRCGKSRLIRELISGKRSVLYVGDDTEGSLQRAGLATEIARLLSGFDEATYPQWSSLFQRFWSDAPKGTVLVLDEFPSMVAVSPELPSVLQKRIDEPADRIVHLVLAGSSQRMMQGLVLDGSAPLYGRATEILKLSPLSLFWIQRALRFPKAKAAAAVEAYAVWGGIPRYWELASDHPDRRDAIRELVLSPLGVLHEEPRRLLTDDLRETTQASSILSLIGGGSHRMSGIAGRLEKPATSPSRPLQRLVELELVTRDIPFRSSPRTTKRSLYRIVRSSASGFASSSRTFRASKDAPSPPSPTTSSATFRTMWAGYGKTSFARASPARPTRTSNGDRRGAGGARVSTANPWRSTSSRRASRGARYSWARSSGPPTRIWRASFRRWSERPPSFLSLAAKRSF